MYTRKGIALYITEAFSRAGLPPPEGALSLEDFRKARVPLSQGALSFFDGIGLLNSAGVEDFKEAVTAYINQIKSNARTPRAASVIVGSRPSKQGGQGAGLEKPG